MTPGVRDHVHELPAGGEARCVVPGCTWSPPLPAAWRKAGHFLWKERPAAAHVRANGADHVAFVDDERAERERETHRTEEARRYPT